MRHLMLLMPLLCIAPTSIAQQEPRIAIFGIATLPCGDALQAMERNRSAQQIYGAWLQGYITGRNTERINQNADARAGSKTTMDTLIAALKAQCTKDVFVPMFVAAGEIYKQLDSNVP